MKEAPWLDKVLSTTVNDVCEKKYSTLAANVKDEIVIR